MKKCLEVMRRGVYDMTVYVITSGEYSDYGIVTVFTSKEKAEIYCATKNGSASYDKCRIEEYETDIEQIESNLTPKMVWSARVTEKGQNCNLYSSHLSFKEINHVEQWHDGAFYVVATLDKDLSIEEVEKIIHDRLAKWKAEREGL